MFTIGAGKSCSFKKLKVYETKLYIHIIIFAFFINLNFKLNAIQTTYKKYKK